LRTAPLGMNKNSTLRVSADLLDLKAAPPALPGGSCSSGKRGREVESRLRRALTLDKPRECGALGCAGQPQRFRRRAKSGKARDERHQGSTQRLLTEHRPWRPPAADPAPATSTPRRPCRHVSRVRRVRAPVHHQGAGQEVPPQGRCCARSRGGWCRLPYTHRMAPDCSIIASSFHSLLLLLLLLTCSAVVSLLCVSVSLNSLG